MKVPCPDCGSTLKESRETRPYECGLKHVTLKGVLMRRCPSCDYYEVGIYRMEQLHRVLIRCVIEKATRLRGDEVRFLRRSLGWSGAEFAKRMGVAEETVSRWENDAAPIGPQADRLLRVLAAQDQLMIAFPADRLSRIDPKRATVSRLKLETRKNRWQLCA